MAFWRKFYKSEPVLVPEPEVPVDSNHVYENVSVLSNLAGKTKVHLKFDGTDGYGLNYFIDKWGDTLYLYNPNNIKLTRGHCYILEIEFPRNINKKLYNTTTQTDYR